MRGLEAVAARSYFFGSTTSGLWGRAESATAAASAALSATVPPLTPRIFKIGRSSATE